MSQLQPDSLPVRETARVILLDNAARVLLIKIERQDVYDASKPFFQPFWITPGGKVESGETPEQAVVRELSEETGISDAEPIGRIWYGEHILDWKGTPTLMKEHFFLFRTRTAVISLDGMESEEREVYRNHRWWHPDEIRSSNDVFIPKQMPDLIEPLGLGKIPTETLIIDLSTPD